VKEDITEEEGGQHLSFESLDNPDHILSADGALGHLLATVGAGTHVATLQHHAVNLGEHG